MHAACYNLGIRKRLSILKTVCVTRKQQLSPKAHKLYNMSAKLKTIPSRLDFECRKERLRQADNFVQSEGFLRSVVNETSCKFIMPQIKLQKHKSRGRKFTMDDKVFALSIKKQSPKEYRLLQKVFALPSRKNLNMLLNQIPFNSGINDEIIRSLKHICASLKENYKLCTIIFDEMSLEAGLS